MGEHHLSDPDSTTPTNVISNSDLKLALISLLYGGKKDLHILDIILQKWLKVTSVAEPEESPEFLLKLVLDYRDLLFNVLLTVLVNCKHII